MSTVHFSSGDNPIHYVTGWAFMALTPTGLMYIVKNSPNYDTGTFINKIGTTGVEEYEFIYDGSAWHLGEHAVILSEYGITITGTAQANDKVIIIESASELVFDVIGIDVETPSDSSKTHSLSLALHDCLSGLQFDAPEALYYAESGLAAGNYGFTFDGTKYTFTLTNAVPTGGQLVFDRGAAQIKVYASSASTTATETASTTSVVSFPDGTTDLGTANGQTTNMNNANGVVPDCEKRSY